MTRNRPSVTVNCVADRYANHKTERIVEFSIPAYGDQPAVGGLIAVGRDYEGSPRIEVYRCDPGIRFLVPKDGEAVV